MSAVRTRFALAVVVLLSLGAAATIVMLVNRLQESRQAQVVLAKTSRDLVRLQGLPWLADPRTGAPPAANHALMLASEHSIDSGLGDLLRNRPPAPLRAVPALLHRNYVGLDRIFEVGRQGHGWGNPREAATLQMGSERPVERAYTLLDAASGTYGTRASRAYWTAIGGSIAVVVLLLGGFAYFFRRSVRVTREQARTLEKLELAQADRAKLLERTVEVAEHERIRVAMDLHDGPIQALTAIAFKLDLLVMRIERGDLDAVPPAVEEVRSSLSAEMVSLRRLMVELRPPILDERGLAAALHDSAAEVLDDSEIGWEVHADVEETRFRPELETVVYRVAREALLNARKHSQADRLWVLLEHRDDGLHLEIVDDGVGFDEEAEEPAIGGGRYGLLGMKERVESVGGTWAVHTAPGAGTRCEATLPWQERTEPTAQTRAGHASA